MEPPTRLVFIEPAAGLRTDIRFEVSAAGTTVVVHQRRLPSEFQTEQAADGLAGLLGQLAAVLPPIDHPA